ncbi:uncharacterized protein LOC116612328 [Nematostella vectensis]|uniref:uncharacterized protein LOC116612328 n=1 Tax=Nematostella vectensis TaxID=45351 RepID=UPI00139036D5|nr:uncharacterized protein LOC116612328 [Nematostella vectensis]
MIRMLFATLLITIITANFHVVFSNMNSSTEKPEDSTTECYNCVSEEGNCLVNLQECVLGWCSKTVKNNKVVKTCASQRICEDQTNACAAQGCENFCCDSDKCNGVTTTGIPAYAILFGVAAVFVYMV